MRSHTTTTLGTLAAAILLTGAPADAQDDRPAAPAPAPAATAQSAPVAPIGQVPDGLLAWVGCWNGIGAASGTAVCFVPTDAGLERHTFRDSQRIETATLALDRPGRVDGEGCAGTETLTLSADTRRVYSQTELVCGERTERRTRGLMAMLSRTTWVDVTSAAIAGEEPAWTATYELASRARSEALVGRDPAAGREMAVQSARIAAVSARPYVDALVEATNRVGARGAEAWIAAWGEPFRLDADALVRLADAGVPPSVIDVAVALSFPDRFQVARAEPDDDRYDSRGRYGRVNCYGRGASSWWWDSPYWAGYGYDRYDSCYGYNRYGYVDRFGGYYHPTYVTVTPREEPKGKWVKGRGFVPDNSGTAGSWGSDRSTTSSGSTSSGSEPKRTAKPRGGGGGGEG